jgi:hypothetical protein
LVNVRLTVQEKNRLSLHSPAYTESQPVMNS